MRGMEREERAGARRGSLALRCPVASEPDGPGSGARFYAARRDAEVCRNKQAVGRFPGVSASGRLCGELTDSGHFKARIEIDRPIEALTLEAR